MSNHSRKHFLSISAGAASALVAGPAFAAPGVGTQYGQQIVIGVCVPLTGDQAALGQQVADGAAVAVYEANRLIGTLDRSFAVRTFDDADTIVTAIMSAQFAGADPTVIATVGNLSGSITSAVLPQYANAKMPLIVPASSADSITSRGYRNVFRLPTKDSTEGSLFARYLAGVGKPKKAIALTTDGDYGKDVARGFVQQAGLEKIPAELVMFRPVNPPYTDVVKRVVGAAPDYVFLAGDTATLGPIVPELRSGGYTGAFGASQGFYNGVTIDKYAQDLGKGAIISTSMPPLDRVTAANDYLADLRSRTGDVTPLVAFGFAAAQLAIAAVKRTGAADRLSLLHALQNATSYDTLVGTFAFSITGDPLNPNLYFYSVADGRFKYVSAAHSSSFLL